MQCDTARNDSKTDKTTQKVTAVATQETANKKPKNLKKPKKTYLGYVRFF